MKFAEIVILCCLVFDSSSARSNSQQPVQKGELRAFSEELYQLESNSIGSKINLNYQSKTSSKDKNDLAPRPLFQNVNPNLLQGPTWSSFIKLLDNYSPYVSVKEDNTAAEANEIDAFLDAVMKTNVMKKTEEFLKKKGYITGSLRPQLERIWFDSYSRHRGILGSSGFEHVFLGEIKKGKVSGFHNWLFFQRQEKKNNINYMGYLTQLDLGNKGTLVKMRFSWLNKVKLGGSMFIGTSPEFEMALYTVCFFTRPNRDCTMQIHKKRFSIKTHVQTGMIGSAYPQI